ncbi:MAG: DEAD/DEAH box helicase [Marinilabiliaceae bacterium]|nr:DEAD/DEAH box helicase [Marinilabiliaceae bacterium]
MRFEEFGIEQGILKSIQKLGFKRPTDIQYKSIRPILEGEDVLAIAQTGTGKTAAFVIPILHRLQLRKKSSRKGGVRCLVMVPTHELALQITDVFFQIGKHTRLDFLALFGGVSQEPQIEKLQSGVDVLVATPGRVFDLVNQKHLDLASVEILVLDEADHMLALGFLKDIRDLIRFLPSRRQTLFFSATIDANIKKLAYSLVSKPIRIQISPKNPVAKNVDHSVTMIKMDDKRFFLERLINNHPDGKILVFVRTKVRAERVCKAMDRVGIKCITIHGGKDQVDRDISMKLFKSGDVKVLIATDLSARGIDIPDVDYVVNYDLPEKPENYVHRVGRTGRGTQKGLALSFCSDEEKMSLDEIEKYLGDSIKLVEIEQDIYNNVIDFSSQTSSDWKTLMRDAEKNTVKQKKKRK